MQASIIAVESSVNHLRDKLAGESNNEGVGNYRDPKKMIFYPHKANDNWLHLPRVSIMSSQTPML